jgi:hypothetical protein
MSSHRLDEQKLAAARVFATSRYPYLASALFAAPVRPALHSGTIAIDRRWCIHADPEIVEQISAPELGRLIVHLVSHVLREHGRRAVGAGMAGEDSDPVAWNRATDAEINDDLIPSGMVPERAPELPSAFGAEDGRLAEHYYELARGQARRWDCGSGCDGVSRPWDSESDQEDREGLAVSERNGEWLRLAVAAELHRAEAAEPGAGCGGPNSSFRRRPTGDECWPPKFTRVSPERLEWSTTATGGRRVVTRLRPPSSFPRSNVLFQMWPSSATHQGR